MCKQTGTQGEHPVKTGVMLPPAMELAEAGAETRTDLPWAFKASLAPQTPSSWTSSLRAVSQGISVV